jgi:hypothetical protein
MIYDIYMVLDNGLDCWWQGEAESSAEALDKAWDYAENESYYNSVPVSWDIEESV